MARTRLGQVLESEMSWRLRLLVVLAALLLVGVMFVPLWGITLYSNQYPDGLTVDVRAGGFEAGREGTDLVEINTLNHYIGMKPLNQADIPELQWMSVVIGVFVLLAMRVAVFGRVSNLVDLVTLFGYFGIASMGLFYYRLYEYGHSLDPRAAVKVPPFTPPLFGTEQLANFTVESYPAPGTYLLLLFMAVLVVALALAWRSARGGFGTGRQGAAAASGPA